MYAAIATVLTILIGYPLAYVIAFRGGKYKNILLGLVVIPFFTSYLIRTIAWSTILADRGVVVRVLHAVGLENVFEWMHIMDNGKLLNTPAAVIGGLTYNFLPFMLLPIYVSLEKIDTNLVNAAAARFGSQCIVVAIDVKRVSEPESVPRYELFTHGGRKPTGIEAVSWAKKMAALGAGELLLTSMDRDGTRDGFELTITREITDSVDIPVIASGGVGTLQHLADGVTQGGADAVLAASIFHFGEYTVREAKQFMASEGIPMRL